jgi:hypothetical protein
MNDNKKTIVCDPLGTPQVINEDKIWLVGHKIIDNIDNYDINYTSFFNYEKECNDKKQYFTTEEDIKTYVLKHYKII